MCKEKPIVTMGLSVVHLLIDVLIAWVVLMLILLATNGLDNLLDQDYIGDVLFVHYLPHTAIIMAIPATFIAGLRYVYYFYRKI